MTAILRKAPSGPPVSSALGDAAGQLWYFDGTLWKATIAAPANGQQPQWDATARDYTFVTNGVGAIQYFDLIADTVALWNFDGTLADQSGNGLDLTLEAGTYGFADIAPGKRGLRYSTGARFAVAGAAAPLRLLGALTIELIECRDAGLATAENILVAYGGSGETEDTNIAYQLSIPLVLATNPVQLQYFAERQAGVNITYATGTTSGSPSLGNIHETEYVAMTRSAAGQVQFYANGRPFGPRSVGLPVPTGATNARAFVAALQTGVSAGRNILLGIRVTARELTASEIAASYNRTLGPGYGFV